MPFLTLCLRDLRAHLRQPLLWSLAAGFVVLAGLFFLLQVEHYQQVRPLLHRQEHPPGASDLILVPWAFNTALAFMVLVPMLAGRAFVAEYRHGLLPLALGWRMHPTGWLLARWLGWWLPFLGLLTVIAFMPLGLALAGPVDLGRMLPSLLALALAITAFSAVTVALAAWVRDPAMASLASFLLLLLLWILDWSARGQAVDLDAAIFQLSLFEHFRRMNAGLIHASDLAWFAGFTGLFLLLGSGRLAGFRQGGLRALLTHLPAVLLWLAACWALAASGWVWDTSWQQRLSLQPATRALLQQVQAPIHITAWVGENDPLRGQIRRFLQPWQQQQPLLQLQFRDPAEEADTARGQAIRTEGTLIIRQGERQQRLEHALDEAALARALWRVQLEGLGPVAMLQCPDCGSLEDRTPSGFSALVKELQLRGLQVFPLKLEQVAGIPLRTRLLLIAGPATRLTPAAGQAIQRWLDDGGSLLWLADVEVMEHPPALWSAWGLQVADAWPNHRVLPSGEGNVPPALIGPLLWEEPDTENWQVLWRCRNRPCALYQEQIQANGRHSRRLLLGDSDLGRNRWLNRPGYGEAWAPLLGWLLDAERQFTLPLLQPPDSGLEIPPELQARLGLVWLLFVPLTLLVIGRILRLKPCAQTLRTPS